MEFFFSSARRVLNKLIIFLVACILKPTGENLPGPENSENLETVDSLSHSPEHIITIPSSSGNQNSGNELQSRKDPSLSKIVKDRNWQGLQRLGGVKGAADKFKQEISNDNFHQETKGVPQHHPIPLYFSQFIPEACNNWTIRILLLIAALSFGFEIKEEGPENGWYDGAFTVLTIITLVMFHATRSYLHARKSRYKSKKQKDPKEVNVIRGGQESMGILSSNLVRGDTVVLERGCQVPADGLLIDGQDLELDGGLRYDKVTDYEQKPFLFQGMRVMNGNARMLVVSVGMDTEWNDMMSKVTSSPDKKLRLEVHLDNLANCLNITGLLVTTIVIIVSFLQFVFGKVDDENGHRSDSQGEPTEIKMIINSIEKILTEPTGTVRASMRLLSVSLVGIMEAIPLVISVAIAYWNQQTLSGKATDWDFFAHLKMASATIICTDTIGGLTEHQIEVASFSVGKEVITETSTISQDVLELLHEGIGIFGIISLSSPCSSTGAAILSWAEKTLGMRSEIVKQSCSFSELKGQNPEIEPCEFLLEYKRRRVWEGPATEILNLCSYYYDSEGNKEAIDVQERRVFEQVIKDMQDKQLKTIAFACKGTDASVADESGLTWVGMIGLNDISWVERRRVIKTCRDAGVKIILFSQDDVSKLAKYINGREGWNTSLSNGLILRGEDLQKLDDKEAMAEVDKICVLGNCNAYDKFLLVRRLREKDEKVVVFGQRTDDCLALKEANIGLSIGSCSSEKVKESSDITIEDWEFIFDMIKYGKCIYGNIQIFIQLELIMIVSSTLVNFIGTASLGDAPITPIQWFWVNLLVSFLGAIAILKGPKPGNLMNMPRISPMNTLITKAMARNIAVHASYQTTILVILQHIGPDILGITHEECNTMVFNAFVVCQFFNLLNAREMQKKNPFAGITENHWFWVSLGVFVAFQAIFVMIEHTLLNHASLDFRLWTGCLTIGSASCPIDHTEKWISGFINIDWLTGWMTDLAGKCKSFYTSNSRSDIEFGRLTKPAASKSESKFNHPTPMS